MKETLKADIGVGERRDYHLAPVSAVGAAGTALLLGVK